MFQKWMSQNQLPKSKSLQRFETEEWWFIEDVVEL